MVNFAPGDEVVCVDDDFTAFAHFKNHGERYPAKGRRYTVREVEPEGLRLNEIVNPCVQYADMFAELAFAFRRFRPVKRETIEIFRAMCASNKPLVEV